jgi:EmrB/QacA subfamily drug resistance transporter
MQRRWKVLLVTSVAVFMAFLDVTIVNVAFPSIRRAFPDTPLAGLSWILNAYNIVFAALLIPAGRLADRIGRRRMFLAGLGVFVAASALCGVAPSVPALVVARAVQAAGAAVLVPTSLGLLLPEFPPERRATATALWGSIGGIAAATGPSLGGLLVQWAGWRWVFFVNLLFGLAAVGPARRLLHEIRDSARGALPDPLGVGVLAASVGALSLGIVEAPSWGWGSAGVLAALIGGAAGLAAFVVRAATHRDPVVELGLFRVRSFALACAGTFVFSVGFYGLLLANILFVTSVWGWSTLRAGFAVTPGPLMAFAAAACAGRIADRYGQRVVAVPGGLVFAAGCALLATRIGPHPAYVADQLPAMLLTGTGVGLSYAGFGSAAVAELPPARFATGSAINSCARQLGAVLGIAVLVAVVGRGGLHAFHAAWWLMACTGTAAALAASALGRVRVRDPQAVTAPA